MDLGLRDAPVLITGAASGIGLGCALGFAREGARLGLLDRSADGLERAARLVEEAGGTAVAHVADVTDEDGMATAIGALADRLGGIRIAVGCAGISGPFGQSPERIALEDWNRVLAVNVTGQFLLVKHALPHLARATDAAIVFLGSDSGFVAAPGMLPYNASKGAVVQFTRALSVELADAGIRVNAVCPSIVDTPMARADLGLEDEGFAGVGYPVQTTDEVARHVLYLSSRASRPVNGTALVSDFGYLARSSFPA